MHDSSLLDPATLESLGSMQVRATQLVEGIIAGLHRSPHKGGSVEFSEYVEYTPGHELRHIDWKVFGKSDRYVVKQYEDETNLMAYMVIDGSGSMDWASEEAKITKLRYVSFLAAALSFLLIRQGDAVGAMSFGEEVHQFLPASAKSSHLEDLFFLLDRAATREGTGLDKALHTLVERARRRALVLIFSDMLGAKEETFDALRVMSARRFDVVLFHVIDPAELDLPFEGLTQFEGLEGEGIILADPDDVRDQYTALMHAHLAEVERTCTGADIGYHRCLTTTPIEEVALQFLRRRR